MELPFVRLSFFTALLVCSSAKIEQMKINIITVILGDSTLYGYPPIVPAFDVAFEDMKVKYPHLFVNATRYNVYKRGPFDCDATEQLMPSVAATDVWDIVERTSSEDNLTVILCPGCSLSVFQLADFARDWDIVIFASTGSNPDLGNKLRYPTVTTYPAVDDGTVSTSAKMFIDMFNWKTIVLLRDFLLQYEDLASYYDYSYLNIKKALDEEKEKGYSAYTISFDSNITQDYAPFLCQIPTISRVVIIFTHPRILRDIMIVARSLNMTNGDYIFLTSQTTSAPSYGNLTWQFFNSDDQLAFDAYQTLITFLNPDPDWDQLTDFLASYSRIAKDQHNLTIPEDDKRNDLAVSAYEAFAVFAMVLNESFDDLASLRSGRAFVKKLSNRTYTFPFRKFYLNNNGIRVSDVIFQRLNPATGKMEETWRYLAVPSKIVSLSNLSQIWRGNHGPPLDIPVCGLRNELCAVSWASFTKSTMAAALPPVAVVLVLIIGFTVWRLNWRRKKYRSAPWWTLDPAQFKPASKYLNLARESVEIPGPGGAGCPYERTGVTAGLQIYGTTAVWAQGFGSPYFGDDIPSSIHTILHSVKLLNHENIGRLVGIVTTIRDSYVLFEYGARGCLRMLLSNESFGIDTAMQGSVIWELVEGLEYLHNSKLHVHGALTSITAMVDKRFCVRICDYATSAMTFIFTQRFLVSLDDVRLFWKAPEVIKYDRMPLTRESDMYSLGVIIAEVMTRNTPLGVKLDEHRSIHACLLQIQSDTNRPRVALPPESDTIDLIRNLITSCTSIAITERPTLKALMTTLRRVLPKENLVNSILTRLQNYGEDLEDLVARRTHELILEADKVDTLLREMIPAKFVSRLRNKQLVPAETFDSVTLLFSDFPQFALISAHTAPTQLTILLNYIYTTFDKILVQYDVYKVETISDSYLVASGLPVRNGIRHAAEAAALALAMQSATKAMVLPMTLTEPMQLRVGLNSGPCAAGVVGLRMPRYCLFGDTINTTSRMESYGAVSKIHVSATTKALLDQLGGFVLERRGEINVKGKGTMETFWLYS